MSRYLGFVGLLIVWFVSANVANMARAYVDITPSIANVIKEAQHITVIRVEKVSQEKQVIVFKKVEDLKGNLPDETLRHRIAEGFHPREPRLVLEWAEPGKFAICFSNGDASLVCIGEYWYQCAELSDHWWTMTTGRPELSLAYYGRIERLREHIPGILAGKEEIVTVINHGAHEGVFQYNNVAFMKVLRGKDCPVWRVKASLKMPDRVWEVGDKSSPWVIGPGAVGPEDVPKLVAILRNSPDVEKRRITADELGMGGGRASAALPELYWAIESDSDPMVRVNAARAAGLISDDYTKPIAALKKLLTNPNPLVRKGAADAFGDLGADAKDGVDALRLALKDKEAQVRWTAAEALGRIGPAAESGVPDLVVAVHDPHIRVIAADALGGIGGGAKSAVPTLLKCLQGEDQELRWTAAVALTRIDVKAAKAAMPLFIERLQTDDHRARWDVLQFITPMGLEAKEAAPVVRNIVIERGNGVAAETLAAIAGPDGIDALPVLLDILADDWDTTGSIAKIGPAAVPQIAKHLQNEKATNRHLAVKALGLLAPQSDAAVAALKTAMQNNNPAIRKAATESLEKFLSQ